MWRAAFCTALILCLAAVSLRPVEAFDPQCPTAKNSLQRCQCLDGSFGVCWEQECDLCEKQNIRMKRQIEPRRRPGGGSRDCGCPLRFARWCECSRTGHASVCCCPWTRHPACR